MDQIEIRGLRLFGRHGCHDEETRLGQRFSLDLVVFCDCSAAARSDDLADAVDYGRVVATATEAFSAPCKLIETAATRVGEAVLAAEPLASGVEIALRKPSAPVEAIFDAAAVVIRLRRDG